jgi:hypothetical protein
MLAYQRGRYWPDAIPTALKPAFDQAITQLNNRQ